jgi:hypothetical protein
MQPENVALVSWIQPDFGPLGTRVVFEFWAKVQAKKRIYPQIVNSQVYTIPPTGGNGIDTFRRGGSVNGSNITLSQLIGGLLTVQMVSVRQDPIGHSFIQGPPSNAVEILIVNTP